MAKAQWLLDLEKKQGKKKKPKVKKKKKGKVKERKPDRFYDSKEGIVFPVYVFKDGKRLFKINNHVEMGHRGFSWVDLGTALKYKTPFRGHYVSYNKKM